MKQVRMNIVLYDRLVENADQNHAVTFQCFDTIKLRGVYVKFIGINIGNEPKKHRELDLIKFLTYVTVMSCSDYCGVKLTTEE
jgi:hypothetical protein